MKKITKYKVIGLSDTKPEVSKDFTVEEVVTEVPLEALEVESIHSNTFRLTESNYGGDMGAKFIIGTHSRHLRLREATKIRDWLNDFIESNTELRVFTDRDGSARNRWYEVAPDQFIYSKDRASAVRSFSGDNSDGWDYETLKNAYAPLTLVKE